MPISAGLRFRSGGLRPAPGGYETGSSVGWNDEMINQHSAIQHSEFRLLLLKVGVRHEHVSFERLGERNTAPEIREETDEGWRAHVFEQHVDRHGTLRVSQ